MSASPLLVPINLEALVVNARMRTLPFRRWVLAYRVLPKSKSPEPAAFEGESAISSAADEGIYLRWELPAALRQGRHDARAGHVAFPLVPNRWLIVRLSGDLAHRDTRAWVIESDCPGVSGSSSLYLVAPEIVRAWTASADPNRRHAAAFMKQDEPDATLLGRMHALAGWTERGIDQLFLTAVAPGNPLFGTYQPHNNGIFSFHDPLGTAHVPAGVFSYFVAGWYSHPAADPLQVARTPRPGGGTPPNPLETMMSDYRWTLAGGESIEAAAPERSFYHGMTWRVDWQPDGDLPPSGRTKIANLHVAIGNTTADAFAAMVEQQLRDQPAPGSIAPAAASRLIEAFQHDLLSELDQPGGDAVLDQRIHASWFGSKPGGYRWLVADASDDAVTRKPEAQRRAEAAQESWLAELNAQQARFDEAARELAAAQWQLYATWWKRERLLKMNDYERPTGVTLADFARALDPLNPAGLPLRVRILAERLEALAAGLPRPSPAPELTPEQALRAGIELFEKTKRDAGQLAPGRILKTTASPRYWAATGPSVLICGAHNDTPLVADRALRCRLAPQIVRGLVAGNGAPLVGRVGRVLAAPDFARLEAALPALFAEFVLFDRDNAAALAGPLGFSSPAELEQRIATATSGDAKEFHGIPPDLELGPWAQPWRPMFVEWSADWHPIDYATGGERNWTFDGTDYRFTGKPPKQLQPVPVSGRALLTPQSGFVFKQRLRSFLKAHPGATDLAAIEQFVAQVEQWDFVSQSLGSFNDQLAGVDRRPNRAPDNRETLVFADGRRATLRELVGTELDRLPLIPQFVPFTGCRQGQFAVTQLIIYDTFGQRVEVVGDSGLSGADKFRPILAPGLQPDARPISPVNPFRFAQLPPRLLQHARLDFRLVDAGQPARFVDLDPTAMPVGGWVLPNHLDAGLMLYDAEGAALGELRVVARENGEAVDWSPAPHSVIATLALLRSHAPLLGNFVDGLRDRTAASFAHFLDTIDRALWTIDPLGEWTDGNLAPLIGRPLALVRTRLQLALDGPPANSTDWPASFDPPPPAFTSFDFEVRLGDQEIRHDGLIGYFAGGNFGTFNCVPLPPDAEPADLPADAFIKPIGVGNFISLRCDGKTAADVTLLLDPRAAAHAVSGILPVKALTLPARFFDDALSRMEVSFRIGPILAHERAAAAAPPGSAAASAALALPAPIEKNGAWSWWQKVARDGAAADWQTQPLAPSDARARFAGEPALRDGFLQLSINLDKTSP